MTEASATRGKINDRFRLRMSPDRVAFHEARPAWQREQTAAMYEHIGTGDVVFYTGAEAGDYPALLATWGARVVCIEPQPRYWPSIRAHMRANLAQPLASFVGFATDVDLRWEKGLWVEPEWPPCADGPIEPDVGFLHVACDTGTPRVRLDTLAEVLPAPSALCIDVEGAEYRVLQGAERILAERRPLIFLSVHLDQAWLDSQYPGEDWPAIEALLERHDYEHGVLGESHERHVLCTPR